MLNRLLSNTGFNSFRALASTVGGVGQLRNAGRLFMKGGRAIGRGRMGRGKGFIGMAGREMAGWAGGAGFTGARRGGISAARIGGTALAAGATADFLNPWGLGFGD